MIRFLDLKKINGRYETAFQDTLKSVLESGWYILGKEVETFEKNLPAIVKPNTVWAWAMVWML